jgi:hypothetical protein
MNENDVVKLMKSSNSEQEWNANCQKVKAAFNGYPDFWHASIFDSSVYAEAIDNFR